MTVLAADENDRFPTLLDGDEAGVDVLLVRSPISIASDGDEDVEIVAAAVLSPEELDASVDEAVLEGGTS